MREYIDFAKIKGFPSLFIDYVNNFDKVNDFYSGNPFLETSYKKILNSIIIRKEAREQLTRILKKQNSNNKAVENIDCLEDEKCFAVVTGQQPGILTGPIYTIYKALTAIKLSESLKEKYGYNLVPIFWIEANDHDFEEIRTVNLIDKKKSPVSIKFEPEIEFKNRPLGEINFDSGIEKFLQNLCQYLQDNEFKAEILELLNKCCGKSTSIVSSFRMFISYLLKGMGMIMLDPSDKEIKVLAADIFLKIAENWKELNAVYLQTGTRLKKLGYKPEVKIRENSLNLFYNISGQRLPIFIENNDIIIGSRRLIMKKQELFDKIQKHPERFSPNVLTRPIMQDFLLPTLSYVAGPTEISYFAQFSEAYKFIGINMPIIFPRASATLINKKINNILTKNNISLSELMVKKDLLKNKLIKESMNPELVKLFEESENEIDTAHRKISTAAESIDITLKQGVDNSFKKIFYQFNKIRNRFEKKIQEKLDVVDSRTEEVNNLIFPYEKLQERMLNILTFISLYGIKVVALLLKELDINSKKHQLIFLEELSGKE